MMNQRTIRTGRVRGFSAIGLPEMLASVDDVHVMHFLQLPVLGTARQFAIQMGGNRGFVQSNSAENELAKLPFEIGRVAIGQAWNRRQPRQRRHQHGVMREPEQIERLASDP